MGKLRVVVVGDAHTAALIVASDLEQSGFDPAVFLAPGEADLERIAPGCELIVAWADATGVPPRRVFEMAGAGVFPPVVVFSEAFTEDEIVGHVRAGAHDCVRRGDTARLKAAVERERVRAASRPTAGRGDVEALRLLAQAGQTPRSLVVDGDRFCLERAVDLRQHERVLVAAEPCNRIRVAQYG